MLAVAVFLVGLLGLLFAGGAGCESSNGAVTDPAQTLCEQTGGAWAAAGGVCTCPAGTTWSADEGCAADEVTACLAGCARECATAAHVCGEDGAFGCPCELACRGIAPAADPQSCCEPVPPACVASCEGDIAGNCTTGHDDYGCLVLHFTTEECAAGACVVEDDASEARCEAADPQALCAATSGTWDGAACDCGPGGAFDGALGCHGVWQERCEAMEKLAAEGPSTAIKVPDRRSAAVAAPRRSRMSGRTET
jgi:hypothetical protein